MTYRHQDVAENGTNMPLFSAIHELEGKQPSIARRSRDVIIRRTASSAPKSQSKPIFDNADTGLMEEYISEAKLV